MYKHNIPGIEKKIEQTLHDLNLQPDISPADFIEKHKGKKHRYASLCTTPSGGKVVFYARLHKNEDTRQKFQQELLFFQDAHNKKNTTKIYIPKLHMHATHKNWSWFVREYVDVPVLGNRYLAKGKLSTKDTPRFVELFHALQNLPIEQRHVLHNRRGGSFYKKVFEGNLRAIQQKFLPNDHAEILAFLQSNYARINKKNKHLIHGDCHPGNIMMDKNHLLVIDWEIIHQDLRVMDIAYFYVTLASFPSFRRDLLSSFYKKISWKKEFTKLFPIGALYFALNQLYVLSRAKPSYLTAQSRKKALAYATAIAKTAIKGYTAIERL